MREADVTLTDFALAALCVIGCGKYGPPVRSTPAPPAEAAHHAASETAGAAPDAASSEASAQDEPDPERERP